MNTKKVDRIDFNFTAKISWLMAPETKEETIRRELLQTEVDTIMFEMEQTVKQILDKRIKEYNDALDLNTLKKKL